jgi:hypothetical protein
MRPTRALLMLVQPMTPHQRGTRGTWVLGSWLLAWLRSVVAWLASYLCNWTIKMTEQRSKPRTTTAFTSNHGPSSYVATIGSRCAPRPEMHATCKDVATDDDGDLTSMIGREGSRCAPPRARKEVAMSRCAESTAPASYALVQRAVPHRRSMAPALVVATHLLLWP